MQIRPTSLMLRPSPTICCKLRPYQPKAFFDRPNIHQSRFYSNPLTPLQTLTSSRILPYHTHELYNVIADINAYSRFIPYCTSSTITSHSSPDPFQKKQWPCTADVRVGYGPYDEAFRSNIYCIPYTTVEAVSGDAETSLSKDQLPHYVTKNKQPEHISVNGSIFNSLLARWSLKEFPFKPSPSDGKPPQEGNANANPSIPRTEVSLLIEVRFASAVYSALSQLAAPKVAGMMIEAFEKRAKEVLGAGYGPTTDAEKYGDNKSSLQGAVGDSTKM